MILNAILAIGLLLSTASQLRVASLPVGPGEILLAVWIGLTVIRETVETGPRPLAELLPLLVFWLVFAMAQCIGLVVGFSIEPFRDTSAFLHDVVAYSFMATMGCLLLLQRRPARRLDQAAWLFVLLGALSIVLLLVAAHGLVRLGPVDPWYWNRLRGWAENPNQLALLTSALTLVTIHLMSDADILRRAILVCCVAVFQLAGSLTRSDSFLLFMLTGAPLLVGLMAWRWLHLSRPRPSMRAMTALTYALLLLPMAMSIAPATPDIAAKAEQAIAKMMDDNDQAESRFKLWREAWQVGTDAWLLGLGPGPHLTSKDYKRPPPAKFEAHNTPLDLLAQSGLLGVASFVTLLVWSFIASWRGGATALAVLVLSLAVFSLFHLIVRQPVFWFSIALCLASATRPIGAAKSARTALVLRTYRGTGGVPARASPV